MRYALAALILGLSLVATAWLLGDTYIHRNKQSETVSVTGLAQVDFTSNLIVWKARFVRNSPDLQAAYALLEEDRRRVRDYLRSMEIADSNVVFSSVSTIPQYNQRYENGNYIGQDFAGYELAQEVQITSRQVAQTEQVSREITSLINQGMQIYSEQPSYYYTDLAELKLEMIAAATADARERAERIAQNANAALGDLKSARLGVFQITGQFENEEYSWGGAFNTWSKDKSAQITMRLEFSID